MKQLLQYILFVIFACLISFGAEQVSYSQVVVSRSRGGGNESKSREFDNMMTLEEKEKAVEAFLSATKQMFDKTEFKDQFEALDNMNTYGTLIAKSLSDGDTIEETVIKVLTQYTKDHIKDKAKDYIKEKLKEQIKEKSFELLSNTAGAAKTIVVSYKAGKWIVYSAVSSLDKETLDKLANSPVGQKFEKLNDKIEWLVFENPKEVLTDWTNTVLGEFGTNIDEVKEVVIEIKESIKETLEDANEAVIDTGNAVIETTGTIWENATEGARDIWGRISSLWGGNKKKEEPSPKKTKPDSGDKNEKENNNNTGGIASGDLVSQPEDGRPGYESQSGDQVCYPDDDKPWGDSQPGDLVSLPIDDGKPEISLPGDLVSLPDDDDGQDDGDSIGDLLIDNIGLPLPTVHYTRLLYFFSGEEISNTLSDQLDSLLSSKFLKNLKKEVERLKQDWANFTKF